jgi:hypothetical protein
MSLSPISRCLAKVAGSLLFGSFVGVHTPLAATLPESGLVLHLSVESFQWLNGDTQLNDGWPDLSPEGNHAMPGEAPVYIREATQNQAAVRFNGSDQYLEAPVRIDEEATVFIVYAYQRLAVPSNYRETLIAAPGADPRLHLASSRSVFPSPDYPTFRATPGDGISVRKWVNGLDTEHATGDHFRERYYVASAIYDAVPSATSLLIGSDGSNSSGAGSNDICEVIVYDRALSESERLAVQDYLGDKYDIAVVRHDLDHPVEAYNLVIGSQQFGNGYSYGQTGNRTLDAARQFYRQGNRTFKMRISRRYNSHDDFYQLSSVNSLATLAEHPQMEAIFNIPFQHYLFWVSTFAVPSWQNQTREVGEVPEQTWIDFYGENRALYAPDTFDDPAKAPTPYQGLSPVHAQRVYDEIYDLVVHLLQTYSGTGKSFYLGNWEGDWMLSGTNTFTDQEIPGHRLQAMIDWANTRQKAINDAKAATPHNNVHVWFYVEMNKADWMRENWVCVANSVIPALDKIDFISISAYSLHKDGGIPAPTSQVHSDLDRIKAIIEAKPAAPDVTGSRVIIGEYGFQYNANHSNLVDLTTANKESTMALLSWPGGTLRFILQWQFYDEAVTDSGAPKEFAQIGDQNDRRPGYYMHENFYRQMRRWVDDRYRQDGIVPSAEAFEEQAVQVLEDISLEEYQQQLNFDDYTSWKLFNFPDSNDRDNPAISGPDAEPDGAGISNLFRYSLGWNRHQAMPTRTPMIQMGTGGPVYAIPQELLKDDLAWNLLGSTDLSAWPLSFFDSTTDSPQADNGWVHIPVPVNYDNGLFLRLAGELVP